MNMNKTSFISYDTERNLGEFSAQSFDVANFTATLDTTHETRVENIMNNILYYLF